MAYNSQNALIVSDTGNNVILQLKNNQVTVYAGSPGQPGITDGAATTVARLYYPQYLAIDDTNDDVYFLDSDATGLYHVRKIDSSTSSVHSIYIENNFF